MSAAVLRSPAVRSLAASSRTTPLVARATYSHVRRYATIPDPTQPTDSPQPNDMPKPGGSGNVLLMLTGVTAVSVGIWMYMNNEEENIHDKRKDDVSEAARKARELADAGKRTAQDVVKEGEKGYNDFKASGKEKLQGAEGTATSYVADTRSAAVRQYDAAKLSAASAYNTTAAKVGDSEAAARATYEDARQKANETTQSWGSWLASWFGYGKSKAEEAESKTATDIAAGAAKVQREAEKRQ